MDAPPLAVGEVLPHPDDRPPRRQPVGDGEHEAGQRRDVRLASRMDLVQPPRDERGIEHGDAEDAARRRIGGGLPRPGLDLDEMGRELPPQRRGSWVRHEIVPLLFL